MSAARPIGAPEPAWRLWPWLALLACMFLAAAAHADDLQSTRRRYVIAALPLEEALARFSQASGIDVLSRAAASRGARSNALDGTYTAVEAIGRLLAGTGLEARFTSPRSAVIIPAGQTAAAWSAPSPHAGGGGGAVLLQLDTMRVSAPRTIGGDAGDGDAFARRLVERIRRIVVDRAVFMGGQRADLRIATRIAPDGALHDVRLIHGSGEREADARIAAALEGAALGLVPPAGLRQPLIFDVAAR